MSNISSAFKNGKAFIPFITCGDPDLETTGKVVRAAAEAGADLIELGIPFSDPTAEGPVIQGANIRALSGGVTTDKIFDFVAELMARCCETGVGGIILPDLPFEEKEEFSAVAKQYGVDLIPLIAPTSADRIAMIAKEAEGFIYIVSSLGVTGMRSEINTDISSIVKVVRENTSIPCAVGFGISKPEQAKQMAAISDGAIVGSAIIRIIEQYGRDAAPYVGEYVKSMKEAVLSAE